MTDLRKMRTVDHRPAGLPEWFPDDQHGYSIGICRCTDGPYLGARRMGTPCCCERCGYMTQDQFDFLMKNAK